MMAEVVPVRVGGFLDATIVNLSDVDLLIALYRAAPGATVASVAGAAGLTAEHGRARLERLALLDLAVLEGDRVEFLARSRMATDSVAWLSANRIRHDRAIRTHVASLPNRIGFEPDDGALSASSKSDTRT